MSTKLIKTEDLKQFGYDAHFCGRVRSCKVVPQVPKYVQDSLHGRDELMNVDGVFGVINAKVEATDNLYFPLSMKIHTGRY